MARQKPVRPLRALTCIKGRGHGVSYLDGAPSSFAMTTIHSGFAAFRRLLPPLLLLLLLLACFATATAGADRIARIAGWQLEQGTEDPSYAVVEPTSSNLNIDTVVLACEQAAERRVLQLQLYLSDDGPLRPRTLRPTPLKDDPTAEIRIDGDTFPVALLFADDYVVVADAREGPFPLLSDRLMAAMQSGQTMVLRFDLLEEPPGERASFDGEAVADLKSGRQAIAVIRRCASSTSESSIGTAQLRP
jgi:hypothetical protein